MVANQSQIHNKVQKRLFLSYFVLKEFMILNQEVFVEFDLLRRQFDFDNNFFQTGNLNINIILSPPEHIVLSNTPITLHFLNQDRSGLLHLLLIALINASLKQQAQFLIGPQLLALPPIDVLNQVDEFLDVVLQGSARQQDLVVLGQQLDLLE